MLCVIELNIVIVTVTDNCSRIHRLEGIRHFSPLFCGQLFRGFRLGLRLGLCVNKSHCSEQQGCTEYDGRGMSE